jgi:diguanylate cyclase (GGDEF)-like protein
MQVLEETRLSDTMVSLLAPQTCEDGTARLVRIYPAAGVGQIIELTDGRQFVGRDPGCEIQLDDDTVSRNHATIERFEKEYAITDLDSKNGTFVNEERIENRWLAAGDRVRIGNQIFKFLSANQIEAQYHEAVYKMMTTDGLTQVYNQRYLTDVLERELRRAARTMQPLCLLMFDIDQFKGVNDTYGHLAGDEVLTEVCRRAKSLLRCEEVLARYGGDEFLLVLSDTRLEAAREAAERLRKKIVETPVRLEPLDIPVSISIGIAETHGEKAMTPAKFIELVDRRLFMAKESGRNRVMG